MQDFCRGQGTHYQKFSLLQAQNATWFKSGEFEWRPCTSDAVPKHEEEILRFQNGECQVLLNQNASGLGFLGAWLLLRLPTHWGNSDFRKRACLQPWSCLLVTCAFFPPCNLQLSLGSIDLIRVKSVLKFTYISLCM